MVRQRMVRATKGTTGREVSRRCAERLNCLAFPRDRMTRRGQALVGSRQGVAGGGMRHKGYLDVNQTYENIILVLFSIFTNLNLIRF